MELSPNPYGPYVTDKGPDAIPSDEVAIFVPKYNEKKADATGAFHIEADNFCDYWNLPKSIINYIDNKLPKSVYRTPNRADALLKVMEDRQSAGRKPIAVWVFLCHGYTHGIQFSIRSAGHRFTDLEYSKRYKRFTNIISDHPAPLVILYACSTGDDPDGDPDTAPGSGDGSFGDLLRDDLCAQRAVFNRVVTHTTAGPTTLNPNIKILDGNGNPLGGKGGDLVADPKTVEFKKLRKLLKTDFRFRFPFMTLASIRNSIK